MEKERQSELELRNEAEELAKNETREMVFLASECLPDERRFMCVCGGWEGSSVQHSWTNHVKEV